MLSSGLGWYGNTERRLKICLDRAIWRHADWLVLSIG